MPKLKAFQIKVRDKILDYRLGEELNLNQVKTFFEKKYRVKKLWSGGRHILGLLEKDNRELFLKLATTEGISVVTQNEYDWNKQFNLLVPRKESDFWVPQNYNCGIYENKLFYLITDKFDGHLLTPRPEKMGLSIDFLNQIPLIIRFSELIQQLDMKYLSHEKNSDYQKVFLEKTNSWYNDIPKDIVKKYKVFELLEIVENGLSILLMRPRHGDFTPWHLFKLKGSQLGLIDGEHAKSFGVEYYDIGYFIQRVFSVLHSPKLAEKILSMLVKNDHKMEKLRVILAARGIGGFLDESLNSSPNYAFSNRFKNWVINLNNNFINYG